MVISQIPPTHPCNETYKASCGLWVPQSHTNTHLTPQSFPGCVVGSMKEEKVVTGGGGQRGRATGCEVIFLAQSHIGVPQRGARIPTQSPWVPVWSRIWLETEQIPTEDSRSHRYTSSQVGCPLKKTATVHISLAWCSISRKSMMGKK